MTVVVVLQKEETPPYFVSSFLMGVCLLLQNKTKQIVKQEALAYVNMFNYFEDHYPLGSQANYIQRS